MCHSSLWRYNPPKTVLIAPTAFKGTITAIEATEAIAEVFAAHWPEAALLKCPLADGGDSTLLVLHYHRPELQLASIEVMGPLPTMRVQAQVGYFEATKTLIIEAAQAHGIAHFSLPEFSHTKQDPLLATSYGVGELIQKGLRLFPQTQHLVITLGGSASTDGGVGALQALGWIFRDCAGAILPSPLSAANLCQIGSVQENSTYWQALSKQLQSITLATDVTNPLLGALGCARVYGPQKGATAKQVGQLEEALMHWHTMYPISSSSTHSLGAAGGLAYGLATLPNITLTSGFHWLMSQTALTTWLTQSDLILTGEGRFDPTSLKGKVLGELLLQRGNTPTLILTGQCDFSKTTLPEACQIVLLSGSQRNSPQELLKKALCQCLL